MVTSGGMECLDLLCRSLLDAGDDVAVEGPTYLGAIMGFRDYGARLTGVPMDAEGLEVGVAAGAAGARLPAEVPLHDPGVPEPVRADADAGAARARSSSCAASTAC